MRCVREIRGVVDGSETKAVAEKRPVWLDFLRAIFVGVFVFVATVGVQMVIIVSANYNTTIKPLVDLNRWMFTQLGWSWGVAHPRELLNLQVLGLGLIVGGAVAYSVWRALRPK